MRPRPVSILGLAVLAGLAACLGDAEVVSVLEPTARVEVTAPTGALLPGQTRQLSARVVGANGRQLSRTVTWASSNTAIATVNNTGLVTALQAGAVDITATHDGVSGSVTLRIDDPCAVVLPFSIGTPVQGTLGEFDCAVGGVRRHTYSLTLANPNIIKFTLNSDAFTPQFSLETADGEPVAIGTRGATPANSVARVILAAGSYRITARAAAAGQSGAYTLSAVSTATQPITGCQVIWITRGLLLTERVDATDCEERIEGQPFFSDFFRIHMQAGRTLRLDLTSQDFDAWLEIRDLDGAILAADDDSGEGTNARLEFTAPRSDVFLINAATKFPNAFGRYALTVQ
jgi:hypothetical protein